MPELPEVETIKRGLEKQIKGFTLVGVKATPDFKKKSPKKINQIVSSRIIEIERIGKVVLFTLSNTDNRLAFHLGMTGGLVVSDDAKHIPKYEKVRFTLKKNSLLKILSYLSIRKFGYVRIVNERWIEDLKRKLGKEPEKLSLAEFKERLSSKRVGVKTVLLDQKVISGLGNIYVNEVLWEARVHPERSASNLMDTELRRILDASRKVIKRAIKYKGSSISDYVDAFGNPGEQQHHFKVYGRRGEPCLRCKNGIKYKKISQRGTFFCSKCQR